VRVHRKRGTVRDLRRENRAAVLWSLYLQHARSRHALSKVTGLSAASVTNVVRELIDEGIVVETGLAQPDGGRPRAMLGINPRYGYVIGVDVGETRTRIGLFDLTMRERAKAEYPLDRTAEHDVGVIVGQIGAGLARVLADGGVETGAVLGVGIGVPGIIERGPVESRRDAVVHGQTYGWDAVPLGRLLRAHTDLPLHFDNGAKTMGQAEQWFGAGRGVRNAAMVLIGSGVGASLISEGFSRGATSSAAEFGHLAVGAGSSGRKCRCGATGCLEAYVGATAILERYGKPIEDGDHEQALSALIDAADTLTEAASILEETALYLGAGIGSLINLFSPERVVVGGWAGLRLGTRILDAIREAARSHSMRYLYDGTEIVLGELGPGAVALGAATLPVEAFLNGSPR
jgi:predicted NBD/HSP70 family sugar kinase